MKACDSVSALLLRVDPIPPSLTVSQAAERFLRDEHRRLLSLPVVDRGSPVGSLSRYQLLNIFLQPFGREIYGPRPVASIMKTEPLTVPIEQPLEDAAHHVVAHMGVPITEDFIITQGGRYAGLGIVPDLLRASVQRLEHSNAELQQFAYVASHDLKEPLRSISSFASLLVRRFSEQDARAQELASYVTGGISRLQGLIDDLLEYTRVTGQPRPFVPCSLEEVVAQALETLDTSIRESQASVTCAALPEVWGAPSQLRVLFQNLVGNAIKFRGAEAPKVAIEAAPRSDGWCVSVRDNGIGIRPEQSGRLFQIFRRLHTEDQYPGNGMGLAICRRIVERHNGKIWVDANHGGGSAFHFTLPAATAAS